MQSIIAVTNIKTLQSQYILMGFCQKSWDIHWAPA